MKDRLISKLRDQKGFTLIELLVVIAIIAILVVIVVVAINPAERLREAADRRAASNVRSSGTLLSTCVTRQNGNLDNCNSQTDVEAAAGGDGQLASTVTFDFTPAVGATTDICVFEQGRTTSASTWWIYRASDGQVRSLVQAAAPAANTCP
ncbi:MAG: prepilin-type N-terminal cleavage/methylation domain-containing protein [Candidatus Woykebacteria bacterium]